MVKHNKIERTRLLKVGQLELRKLETIVVSGTEEYSTVQYVTVQRS